MFSTNIAKYYFQTITTLCSVYTLFTLHPYFEHITVHAWYYATAVLALNIWLCVAYKRRGYFTIKAAQSLQHWPVFHSQFCWILNIHWLCKSSYFPIFCVEFIFCFAHFKMSYILVLRFHLFQVVFDPFFKLNFTFPNSTLFEVACLFAFRHVMSKANVTPSELQGHVTPSKSASRPRPSRDLTRIFDLQKPARMSGAEPGTYLSRGTLRCSGP